MSFRGSFRDTTTTEGVFSGTFYLTMYQESRNLMRSSEEIINRAMLSFL